MHTEIAFFLKKSSLVVVRLEFNLGAAILATSLQHDTKLAGFGGLNRLG